MLQELSKITMPVIFNEPLSFLQRMVEYMEYASKINAMSGEVFRYLNFDKMPSFKKAEEEAKARIIPTLNVA